MIFYRLIHGFAGEGWVTIFGVGDEEGYYEIEVTFAGGRQVDDHFDEEFNVFGKEIKGCGPDDY